MKRIVIYVIVLLLLTLVPIKGADIGSLHPVEILKVYKENDEVYVQTDTGDWGKGVTGSAALEHLKETTAGTIYLDTAKYLLLEKGTEAVAEEIRSLLKKSARLCNADQGVELTEVSSFLSVHGTLPQMEQWNMGDDLPQLTMVEKRLKLL